MVNANKIEYVKNIEQIIGGNQAVALVNHKAVTFKSLEKIRRASSEVKIIKFKNRLLKIGLNNLKINFDDNLKNENLLIVSNDVFAFSKTLNLVAKINSVVISNAQYNNAPLNSSDIKTLSALNTKEELISSVFGSILNIVSSIHGLIDGIIAKKEENV